MLVSWQYNFKAVVAYSLYTIVLDAALLHFWRSDFHQYLDMYARLIFIRAISFLVTGDIIALIIRQFREQRTASQQANQKLDHYAGTLEQLTISRECNRMARELHDLLEQSLQATRSELTETRKAIQSLRATPLEDVGISLAIGELPRPPYWRSATA